MKKLSYLLISAAAFLMTACKDHDPFPGYQEPEQLESESFVEGLNFPIGATLDDEGRLWVTEAGSANDDGAVTLITPQGDKFPFLTGLPSAAPLGNVEGISHPLYHNGKLYILHGVSGMLYIADISGFVPGSGPVDINTLDVENIGDYVNGEALVSPLNSNAYGLTLGPDGDLFIVDAGSNAVIRRRSTDGEYSVFAVIPDVDIRDAVPTGIAFDGEKFLVTVLTGAPFTPGTAKILQISADGSSVSDYKTGFTTLTSVALTLGGKPLVTQLGVFGPDLLSTGKVLDESGNTLLDGLSMPTALIRSGDQSFYLVSYGSGTISILTY